MAERSPAAFLKKLLGRDVSVKLNNGQVITGKLEALDGFVNVALRGAELGSKRFRSLLIRGSSGN